MRSGALVLSQKGKGTYLLEAPYVLFSKLVVALVVLIRFIA